MSWHKKAVLFLAKEKKMSRPVTPSVNVIGISQDGLNFVDEFDDLIEDFDATPRPEVNFIKCIAPTFKRQTLGFKGRQTTVFSNLDA